MADVLDPRRFVYRDNLAAADLKDQVTADRYVEPTLMQVQVPVLDLYAAPGSRALASQLVQGEHFDVFDQSGDWAWGQNKTDGYVGYVPLSGLGDVTPSGTTITVTLSHIYPEPSFKSVPIGQLSMMSQVEVTGVEGAFLETPRGYVSKAHTGSTPEDFVSVAQRFLGLPYLWGGRSAFGLDCSALVQIGLWAVGQPCPRDSDMQLAELGREVAPDEAYRRGDLVFWKGHVGVISDPETLLHANVHAMAVAYEPIDAAVSRIAKTDGPVLAHKRLEAI